MIVNLTEKLQIDKKLEELWSSYKDENSLSPLHPAELRGKAVTFLSLNPSLPPKFRENAKTGFYPEIPYAMVDCEKKPEYPFFKKFYEIGSEFKPWTILDLLYERESNQRELEIKYNPKTIDDQSKEFLLEQIKITFDILDYIKPKVVVITNKATDWLIHSNINDLKFVQSFPSEENGNIYKINGIPFISNESRFLGSRFLEHKEDNRAKLVEEIRRVLA